jgi:hypothetical protein
LSQAGPTWPGRPAQQQGTAGNIAAAATVEDGMTSTPAPGTITMYSTTWCGYCQRLKAQLGKAGIDYTEVNIEEQADSV